MARTPSRHAPAMNGRRNGPSPSEEQVRRQREEAASPVEPYKVFVSLKFLVASVLACCLLSFCVGRAVRIAMLRAYQPPPLVEEQCDPQLPSLIHRDGKKLPTTRYMSKNFDTSRSASSSSWLFKNRDSMETCPVCKDCEDDEETPPVAEHLMVDIKNVDGAFLNSERRLANAMVEMANEAHLTLLSYHCHGLVPTGVSCVGVLLQNYVSFHTWPENGVITFDLCVGGIKSLLPVLPIIERLFGVPQTDPVTGVQLDKPEMKWAHKIRGYPDLSEEWDIASADLGTMILGDLGTDVKEEVVSVETDFQRIDIYDVLFKNDRRRKTYKKSLSQHGPHEPAQERPDRYIMSDGWIQSTLLYEAAYHEALVHPAMFSHSNPKRVAIVGGGEGATLREVLKHNTVEQAIMIEIDEMMVNVSREHIPGWSDCSDLVGSASWCLDDPRATVYYEDALYWFLERYPSSETPNETIDVIVLDALDPELEIEFSEELYSNITFMQSFYDSLSDDGIISMQLGQAAELYHPVESYSKYKNRAAIIRNLESVGFESIQIYEESHCGFGAPWTYVVAFKSYHSRKSWFANAAQVDLAIQKRSLRTKSGVSPFRYFDGPTMVSYQVPPRSVETVFCLREPEPVGCESEEHTYWPEVVNTPATSLEVKVSGVGEKAGRGVFAKVDIPNARYIAPEISAHPVRFFPSTYSLITTFEYEEIAEELEPLVYYMHGYGFTSRKFGDLEAFVDSGITTFVNHGCRGQHNVGEETDFDEFTADPNVIVAHIDGKSHSETTVFNPAVDRHLMFMGDLSIRDIKAGEEILENYLAFIGTDKEWKEDIDDLQSFCLGRDTAGSVTDYETNEGQVAVEED